MNNSHSKYFSKIKRYYDSGFWTKSMLKNAVMKNRITEEEYKEITNNNIEET
jgi:uncharacterized XkdX family phage protein